MPVSGRYTGLMTAPAAGSQGLELRVDVDVQAAHTPVMNRVSGDVYTVVAGAAGPENRYRESWIVEDPKVEFGATEARISGSVSFWNRSDARATIDIRIPSGGAADVTLTLDDGTDETYMCKRSGSEFRDVRLEVEVCKSVAPVRLPEYDLTSHPEHPADLVSRKMTLESAFGEAGVHVTIVNDPGVIDDSADEFESWSNAELHDALVNHFLDAKSEWPRWSLWGLLAGSNEKSDAGLMFDQSAPDRQGFAVFRSPVFAGLPTGPTSAVEDELAALRVYLFTWVHEMGHAFNMVHSSDKLRSKALSWMNNPSEFNGGSGKFWAKFPFQFDEEELIHIRHGNMAAVIMGGDAWSSGGHLHLHDADSRGTRSRKRYANSSAQLELLTRGRTHCDFMAPVKVELRLRNLSPRRLRVDTRLQCQDGNVIIVIRRPDGKTTTYVPMTRRLREPVLKYLEPAGTAEPGADRHSEELDLTYGRKGFYFETPGEYVVQAIYVGRDKKIVRSNAHRLEIASDSHESERLAQDFFSHDVGKCLYLQGSHSPHLQKGFDRLREMVERRSGTASGALLAESIATGIAAQFFRIEKYAVTRFKKADHKGALQFTEPALSVFQSTNDQAFNLVHGRLGLARCRWKRKIGDEGGASQELETLLSVLSKRGVHKSVLDELRRNPNLFLSSQS